MVSDDVKSFLFRRLNEGEMITCILSKKLKTQSRKMRVYLYTEDRDVLLLTAEANQGYTNMYNISSSCDGYECGTPYFLGYLHSNHNSPKYTVRRANQDGSTIDLLDIQYLRRHERPCLERSARIFDLVDVSNTVKQEFFPSLNKIVTGTHFLESIKNFYFVKEDDSHYFSIGKIEKDVYQVNISGPLSVFEGFGICLSTLQLVPNE